MKIDIVTPTRRLSSLKGNAVSLPADITSVVLPTKVGEMQILPGHSPMLTLMGTGVLTFVGSDGPAQIMVSGGFAEVDGDTIRVMTELGSLAEEVDKAAEQKALTQYQKDISGLGPVSTDDDNFAHMQTETERAAAKLNLLN
ncbi:MAG: ATP synthase F1 subunit epsilon [Deltaproteobacteria bacterium]|nr:ATP synthase F1 subunit epsilon [Deltaproteobacteria bacterium]